MEKGIYFYKKLSLSEKKRFLKEIGDDKDTLKFHKEREEPDMKNFIYGAFIIDDYNYWDSLIEKYDSK